MVKFPHYFKATLGYNKVNFTSLTFSTSYSILSFHKKLKECKDIAQKVFTSHFS